mgnify:CR=1 FL=1
MTDVDEEHQLKPYKRCDKNLIGTSSSDMELEDVELPYTVFKRYDHCMYAMRFTVPGHSQIRIGLGTRYLAKAYVLLRLDP